MTISSRPTPTGTLRAHIPSPGVLFAGITALLRTYRNRRAAYRLAELPDYLLNDIGVRRDDVHEALNRGWQEDPTFQIALRASKRRRGL